jgi:hypothetical protein
MYFTCPDCLRSYGDPLYHGPAGHAPPQICFDCWVAGWAWTEMLLRRERGDWKPLNVALLLICQGFTRAETARWVGMSPTNLRRSILGLRKKTEEIPEWLRDRVAKVSERLSTEGRR